MPEQEPIDVGVAERDWNEDGKSATCEFTSDVEITTAEDAMRHGQVDPTVWYVKRMRIGSHQVSMKLRSCKGVDGKGKPIYVHTPVKKSNWKIVLYLERIQDDVRRKALDGLYERLRGFAHGKTPRAKSDALRGTGDHLCEVGLYDAHFGSLVWAPEAYRNHDLREAEEVYANAVADIMDRVSGYRIGRWVMPVGNDFAHFDNLVQTTTRGTRQDADSRHAKVLVACEMAVIRSVHEMLRVAPVDIVIVEGNHDSQTMTALGRIILNHFHGNPHVRVDATPRPRKYYRFGCNLIGYAHGNEESPADLSRIMAQEVPARVWAETTHREFRVGHFHRNKTYRTLDTESYNGIEVRVNPALAETNAWHYRRGFVGARRAARAYINERVGGFVGYFEIPARSRTITTETSSLEIMGE